MEMEMEMEKKEIKREPALGLGYHGGTAISIGLKLHVCMGYQHEDRLRKVS